MRFIIKRNNGPKEITGFAIREGKRSIVEFDRAIVNKRFGIYIPRSLRIYWRRKV